VTTRLQNLSGRDLAAVYLAACAENIQWLLDSHQTKDDELQIAGWALTLCGQPEQAQFLINGRPFSEGHYPLPSPDLAEIFWNIPTAQAARFVCKTSTPSEHTYPDGFARLEFRDGSEPEQVRRRAWYLPRPTDDLPIPNEARINRIGVPDSGNYLIGGASVYKRLEHYLEQKFSKTFNDFNNVLDWGCGCGRVARHFRWAKRTRLCGVDIDGDNIAWCQANLPHAQFLQTGLLPPLPFPEQSYDLLLVMAAFSQLQEEQQLRWLPEFKRVARKDAIVLVSIQGLAQLGLNRPDPGLLREIEEKGFVVAGRNSELDEVVSDPNYYVSVLQSRDYIYRNWGEYFTIIDIVDAMAANQDLVVMKNDK
jgi:SAM-dependent methyltransferase